MIEQTLRNWVKAFDACKLIRARHKRSYKATTVSKLSLPVAPNLLDRSFTPAAPNHVWTADLNFWDIAPTESFFNSLKNERGYDTRYSRKDEAQADLFDYIEPFYNRRRKHSTLDYALPMNFLENWITALREPQLAA